MVVLSDEVWCIVKGYMFDYKYLPMWFDEYCEFLRCIGSVNYERYVGGRFQLVVPYEKSVYLLNRTMEEHKRFLQDMVFVRMVLSVHPKKSFIHGGMFKHYDEELEQYKLMLMLVKSGCVLPVGCGFSSTFFRSNFTFASEIVMSLTKSKFQSMLKVPRDHEMEFIAIAPIFHDTMIPVLTQLNTIGNKMRMMRKYENNTRIDNLTLSMVRKLRLFDDQINIVVDILEKRKIVVLKQPWGRGSQCCMVVDAEKAGNHLIVYNHQK